jgi:hypothetical protein
MYFAIVKQAPPSSIARMIKDPVTPLQIQAPQGYSASFLAAIDKGLAVLSQDRPQTIDAFRELLGIVSLGPPPPVRAIGAIGAGAPAIRADLPFPQDPQVPMPVEPPVPAAVVSPPKQAPLAAAPAAGKRWKFIAVAAALLLTAGLGLYTLVRNAADDTIMLAQPHTTSPQPAVAPEPVPVPVSAPAKAPDPVESLAVAAPPPPEASAPAVHEEVPHAAPPEVKPAAPVIETVSYKLAIKPWGTVYVDGRERGVSPPMKRLSLPAGKHKIRIVNPNFPDYSINLDSGKSKSGTIEHDFAAAKK